jgi:aminobenzoyl-glutamate utilization protein B
VGSNLTVSYGPSLNQNGLVSVEYMFKGESAHAAGAPWRGRSALDAVELMDAGWNFRREHLRLAQRSHYVITNGGDQPNVVPPTPPSGITSARRITTTSWTCGASATTWRRSPRS